MERVAILGCGGSGKTHLARELAKRLDLPLTHLDAVYYYDDDWRELSRVEVATNLLKSTGSILVRNSRDPEGSILAFTLAEWRAFTGGVQDGEFVV